MDGYEQNITPWLDSPYSEPISFCSRRNVYSPLNGHVWRKYCIHGKACASVNEPVKVIASSIATSLSPEYSCSTMKVARSQFTLKREVTASGCLRALILGNCWEASVDLIANAVQYVFLLRYKSKPLRMIARSQLYAEVLLTNSLYRST